MRLPLVRFTIRRCMALVAVAAALLGSGLAARRLVDLRVEYRGRAADHDRQESSAREWLGHLAELKVVAEGAAGPYNAPEARAQLDEMKKSSDPEVRKVAASAIEEEKMAREFATSFDEVVTIARAEVESQAALKRKYQRAAARPWVSIPPDPGPSGVDVKALYDRATREMRTKAEELSRTPPPPELEIVEPKSPGGK